MASEGPAQVEPSAQNEDDVRQDDDDDAAPKPTNAAPLSFAQKRLMQNAEAGTSMQGHKVSRPSPLRSMMTAT